MRTGSGALTCAWNWRISLSPALGLWNAWRTDAVVAMKTASGPAAATRALSRGDADEGCGRGGEVGPLGGQLDFRIAG